MNCIADSIVLYINRGQLHLPQVMVVKPWKLWRLISRDRENSSTCIWMVILHVGKSGQENQDCSREKGFVASPVRAMSSIVDHYQQAKAYGEYTAWQGIMEHIAHFSWTFRQAYLT